MLGSLDLRIGIDVGGTHTDAVVLDSDNQVIAKCKTPTTVDLGGGIDAALGTVLGQLDHPVDRISHIMLGTTQATNAIVERRNLLKVAAIRIGAPATLSIPPMADWPEDLKEAISAGSCTIRGGSELTGEELVPLDVDGLRDFLCRTAARAEAVAITSVFSPVSAKHELRAAQIVSKVLGPEIPISLSHNIGSLGLLERENACILNAALIGSAHRIAFGLSTVLERHEIDASVFLAQNDGTLMGLDYVARFPVLTIGSGPTNSMRGAAYLTGVCDAIVVDVGGTSSDVGMMLDGFPRQSGTPIDIGGVRTNFRMPDLISIAIGGGTMVVREDDSVIVGPESVGFRINSEALVFGGKTATLTDAAVSAGRARLGDVGVPPAYQRPLSKALAIADRLVAEASDQIRTSANEVPIIAVGGGSIILPKRIEGVGSVTRPDNYEVANAIGAAIASVSGQVDRVYDLAGRTRDAIAELACAAAKNQAISAGADPSALEIVELDEVPMAYLSNPVVRIRAKAVGPLGRL